MDWERRVRLRRLLAMIRRVMCAVSSPRFAARLPFRVSERKLGMALSAIGLIALVQYVRALSGQLPGNGSLAIATTTGQTILDIAAILAGILMFRARPVGGSTAAVSLLAGLVLAMASLPFIYSGSRLAYAIALSVVPAIVLYVLIVSRRRQPEAPDKDQALPRPRDDQPLLLCLIVVRFANRQPLSVHFELCEAAKRQVRKASVHPPIGDPFGAEQNRVENRARHAAEFRRRRSTRPPEAPKASEFTISQHCPIATGARAAGVNWPLDNAAPHWLNR